MELFSEHQLNLAYHWLCKQREHYPPNADIWHFRAHWLQEKRGLLKALRTAQYRFSPLQVITTKCGKTIHLWSSRDALVLKMVSLWLPGKIPLSTHCTHLKHHGGLKATVADVQRHLPYYSFVMRTDVKGYYANIDHFILLEQLSLHIKERFVLNLLWQFMRRTVHYGGLYRDITRGISRGCPLSPVIGAFYLKIVDDRLSRSGVYYVRYMDDVLILAATRWKLRRAVKMLNQCFTVLKLEQHPDKTFIGRIEKGFGYYACEPNHPAFQGASSPALRATAGSPGKGCAAG